MKYNENAQRKKKCDEKIVYFYKGESMEKTLENFVPKHSFLVCIDSDGCAFDVMEVKHKECFCPATVNDWDLQAVSRYAREAWEFVNLYSVYRGRGKTVDWIFYAGWQCIEKMDSKRGAAK